MDTVRRLSRPLSDWGPRLKEHRMLMKDAQGLPMENLTDTSKPMLSNGQSGNSEPA